MSTTRIPFEETQTGVWSHQTNSPEKLCSYFASSTIPPSYGYSTTFTCQENGYTSLSLKDQSCIVMKGIDITGKEDNTRLFYESLHRSQLPTTNKKMPKSNVFPFDPILISQMWSELCNICLYHQLRAVLISVYTNGYSLWNLNSRSMPHFSTYYYDYFYLMSISGIWWY